MKQSVLHSKPVYLSDEFIENALKGKNTLEGSSSVTAIRRGEPLQTATATCGDTSLNQNSHTANFKA